MPLQIRRGTDAERQLLVPATGLVVGELLYVTDAQKVYIGTGIEGQHQGLAVTGYTNEDAVDASGAALAAGTHTNISFTYGTTQDAAGRIDATVDLSDYTGTITADAFKGSVFGDDTTLLVNAVDGTFNLNGTIKDDIVPNALGIDLGSSGTPFNDAYLGGTLRIGAATITAVSTAINLPAGSTINGVPLAIPGDTSLNVDITGSVFGDDSSKLIDAVESLIVGEINNDIIITKRLNITSTSTTDIGILINTNAGGAADVDLFNINTHHNDTDPIGAFFTRARGTITAPVAVQSGDAIFNLGFAGEGTDLNLSPAAFITAFVDGTVGSGIVPGKLVLSTSNSSGIMTTALSIDSSQVITVASNTVTAGGASGQANIGSVSTYLKIIIGSTEYAIPAYSINP